MILRSYQSRALDDLRAAYRAGRRAPVLVSPTGSGKTVIAAAVIRSAVQRGGVLFLAHRRELLEQTIRKLAAAGVTDVRLVSAGESIGSGSVTVASVQTITRWTETPAAELVVCDEAHHFTANSFRSITDRYPKARLLGLTATPQRGDGRSLGDVFDALVSSVTVAELEEQGHLVPCEVFAPPRRLNARQAAQTPADAYERHGHGRRAVVFVTTLEQGRAVAASMNGVLVHGSMRAAERAEALAGEPRVLVSAGVLTEGWDDPDVSVCILARAPQHASTYIQMIGRVLRPHPGKTTATLLDLCGAVHTHGLPNADRQYTLDGSGITSDRIPLSQCPACGMVRKQGGRCPCGYVGAGVQRVIDVLGIDLEAVLPKLPPKPMRAIPIRARHGSVCPKCSGGIVAGQTVLWAKGQPARHVVCR